MERAPPEYRASVRKKKDERLNDYFAKIWSFIVDFINNTRVDPTTYRDIIKAATSHLRLELLPIIYPRQLAPSQGPQPKKSAQITAPYPRQPTPPSLKEQKHEPTSTITSKIPNQEILVRIKPASSRAYAVSNLKGENNRYPHI